MWYLMIEYSPKVAQRNDSEEKIEVIWLFLLFYLEKHLVKLQWILLVFPIAILLSIGPVHCIFLITPRVNHSLQCVLLLFIWVFCCDLPQTFKVCCCCERFNTYWKNNRAMPADLSFSFLFVSRPLLVSGRSVIFLILLFPFSLTSHFESLSHCCLLSVLMFHLLTELEGL